MKFIFGIFILSTLLLHNGYSMTEKQMKSAAKLVRNSCQPKTKVSDEQIDNMHTGNWDDESTNVKCYMNCALSLLKVCKKNGEFDMDAAMKQIPQLPENRRIPTESTLKKCSEEVVANDDKCDSSWRFGKCVYFDNPENYFLP